MPETPEGAEVREFHGNCRERLAEELERLLREEKLPLSDIAVLGAHSMEHTCIGSKGVVGRFRMVKNRVARVEKREVSYYTFMKFKGCEAKVVILLDVDIAEARWQDRRSFYVAMSRAVHQLIILHRY